MNRRKALKNIAKKCNIKTKWHWTSKKILYEIQKYILKTVEKTFHEIMIEELEKNNKIN